MKDAIVSASEERTADQEGFANRKLIRPSLNRSEHNHSNHAAPPSGPRPERNDRNGGRKPAPAEQTNAENFYYQKQMQSHTPMVIVLRDGEEIHGTIEWYDKNCIKLNRNGAPNVMVYKPAIKYIYKESEASK